MKRLAALLLVGILAACAPTTPEGFCEAPTRPPKADPSSEQYSEAYARGWELGNAAAEEACQDL